MIASPAVDRIHSALERRTTGLLESHAKPMQSQQRGIASLILSRNALMATERNSTQLNASND